MEVFSKVKQEIVCGFCQGKAWPRNDYKPKDPTTTRYGCENEHYFAVPTRSVAVKD